MSKLKKIKKMLFGSLSRKILVINIFVLFFISSVIFVFPLIDYECTADYLTNKANQCYVASRFVNYDNESSREYLEEIANYYKFNIAIVDYKGNVLMKSKGEDRNYIDFEHPFRWKRNIFYQMYDKNINKDTNYRIYIWKNWPKSKINKFMPVFFILIITPILLMYFYIRKKIKYINYISKEIKELSNGNLNHIIKIKGYDELSVLSNEINNMSRCINEKIREEREEEKRKYELITNISHDLRTPLSSLIGYIQLMENEEIEKTQKEKYIKILKEKATKIKVLIDNLFEYSKLESKGFELNKQDINIIEIINQCISEVSNSAIQKNMVFNEDFNVDEIILNIDGYKIARVFENIFINAIKYGEEDSTIDIEIKKQDNKTLVSITNKCSDLNKENLKKVFERFYRGDISRNSKIEGSGLGLAIVKSIMILHKGEVFVENENDKFTIKLLFK